MGEILSLGVTHSALMMAGAMEVLGRVPDECEYAETWAFVAGKCIAVWRP
jgi:hypothetical protein